MGPGEWKRRSTHSRLKRKEKLRYCGGGESRGSTEDWRRLVGDCVGVEDAETLGAMEGALLLDSARRVGLVLREPGRDLDFVVPMMLRRMFQGLVRVVSSSWP